ncbi:MULTISPECIES: flagellar protein export ATPase FliI [unclassified Azospirillum]|uniref:flagellar protein export ATPase FliI n=1 Tax=unclassified Azospirillum TaxID=2630922 RepID=UPI000B641801|nr:MULTISPECIES: flagellar protein export ATPase FliI [unclassified Azospirillum]SNS72999.1 flagellum-specific ATP synthase [Azospirillum sp. RU38E]SNS90852.1 flagellum-specific ATP synthase [Azospirillum sp. RU37A]
MTILAGLLADIQQIEGPRFHGQVVTCSGLALEVEGLERRLSVGDGCRAFTRDGKPVPCEVVGFRQGRAVLLPFAPLEGIGLGSKVEAGTAMGLVRPHAGWLGRVVDAFGKPMDGKGGLLRGDDNRSLRAAPPPAFDRRRMGARLETGIRVMDSFVPLCQGQRLGIFAGSGVGKSTLLAMLARSSAAQVNVIGLIGERGREVQEFIQDDLGEDGLARSVIIVATGDEPALARRQAAYLTMAVAEFFRDAGHDVLCMMDSVTRFAMAQREIGLSAGEPPTTKGYPPSVFAELPRLLERAGPGRDGQGDITGVFTVLVDGGDHDEPVADAVRGILDGHVVMDRKIAERGRYPAIDVLKSVSRALPGCHSEAENATMQGARSLLSRYEAMEEMIRLGAYRLGSDAEVDQAIKANPSLQEFLRQRKGESTPSTTSFEVLGQIVAEVTAPPPPPPPEPEARKPGAPRGKRG